MVKQGISARAPAAPTFQVKTSQDDDEEVSVAVWPKGEFTRATAAVPPRTGKVQASAVERIFAPRKHKKVEKMFVRKMGRGPELSSPGEGLTKEALGRGLE